MTVIAALANGRDVVMSADTYTVMDQHPSYGARKIYQFTAYDAMGGQHPILLAAAGDGAVLNRFARVAAPMPPIPARSGASSALEAWAGEVADAVATMVAESTFPMVDRSDTAGDAIDASLLLGVRGRLFHLGTHYAVPVTGQHGSSAGELQWATIGSGGREAAGALAAMAGPNAQGDPASVEIMQQMAARSVTLACGLVAEGCGISGDGPMTMTI